MTFKKQATLREFTDAAEERQRDTEERQRDTEEDTADEDEPERLPNRGRMYDITKGVPGAPE
jgi:hypothetical protein